MNVGFTRVVDVEDSEVDELDSSSARTTAAASTATAPVAKRIVGGIAYRLRGLLSGKGTCWKRDGEEQLELVGGFK